MTNGFGLPGYGLEGSMHGVGLEDYAYASYANMFADWLVEAGYADEVNHARLAMSGMRAEDLHWLLELDYNDLEALALTERDPWTSGVPGWTNYQNQKLDYWTEVFRDEWNAKFNAGDFWTWDRMCGDGQGKRTEYWTSYWAAYGILMTGYTDFPANYNPGTHANTNDAQKGEGPWLVNEMGLVAKYYQEKVAQADVITLSIGTGNFGAFLMERVTEVANFDGKPEDVYVYDIESAIRDLSPEMQVKVMELLETCMDILAEQGLEVDDGNPETTTTMEAMRKTVQAITDAGLRDQVKIMVGGAPITQAFADEIGADAYTTDAGSAAETARALAS